MGFFLDIHPFSPSNEISLKLNKWVKIKLHYI